MRVMIKREPPVYHFQITQPEVHNALDLETFRALDQTIDAINADQEIRALVVSSSGQRAFCAGANINDLRGIDAKEATERASYRRHVLQKLADLDVPSLAVIDGFAMGGGVELAAACTFRLATAHSTFSMPEINLGLLPGAGATQRLPRLIGPARAAEMMLTARKVTADEALTWGLINQIITDPETGHIPLLDRLTANSRSAMRGILRAMRRGADLPITTGLAVEGEELAQLSLSRDGIEGVTAFFEKRAACFNQ